MSYIKKDKLKVGQAYHCHARNFETGTWNGREFEYIRTKFNTAYTDTELHWDDGPPHGTVRPITEAPHGTS